MNFDTDDLKKPLELGPETPKKSSTANRPLGSPAELLREFQSDYEINSRFLQSLHKLTLVDTVLVLDDSVAMNVTRWQQLQTMVRIFIAATAIVDVSVDVFFVNRAPVRNVRIWQELEPAFVAPPRGPTNVSAVLDQIRKERVSADMRKTLVTHILTAGAGDNEEMTRLAFFLKERPFKNQTLFSIVMVTDDEETERQFRPFEGYVGVEVTKDYKGKSREIGKAHGNICRFSFGDYCAMTLLGAYDADTRKIGESPEPCCPCCVLC